MQKLLDIMARLRDPAPGCPWEVAQDFRSIAPYTIEEAYEVADAIDREDLGALRDELGDLLLQVVFHARMAEEIGAFDFAAVSEGIAAKMLRRHPHVFGDEDIGSAAAQREAWEAHKQRERDRPGVSAGVLAGVTRGLPALMRASKLGKRASRVGFDWPDTAGVRDKLDEELAELDAALAAGERQAIEEEAGDLLFAAAQLLRHLDCDAEECLRRANRKFESRFRRLESAVDASDRGWADYGPAELNALWDEAKRARDD